MEINNYSNVAFGCKISKKLMENLFVQLECKNNTTIVKNRQKFIRSLNEKINELTNTGSDTFELVCRENPVTNTSNFSLKYADTNIFGQAPVKCRNRKYLLPKFLSIQPQDILKAEASLEDTRQHRFLQIVKFT